MTSLEELQALSEILTRRGLHASARHVDDAMIRAILNPYFSVERGRHQSPKEGPMQMAGSRGAPTGADYNEVDAEFMRKMLPHHEMAVSMAATAYSNGKNEFVRTMALNIFSTQKKEVETMKNWLMARGLKPAPSM